MSGGLRLAEYPLHPLFHRPLDVRSFESLEYQSVFLFRIEPFIMSAPTDFGVVSEPQAPMLSSIIGE